jgi:hypothetical protein
MRLLWGNYGTTFASMQAYTGCGAEFELFCACGKISKNLFLEIAQRGQAGKTQYATGIFRLRFKSCPPETKKK